MTTLFGVPGAQIYPLFDALHGTDVEFIVPRHEQAAAYMAMGYAKSTGRTGVFSVVPGPGVLNAAAALLHGHGQLLADRLPDGPGPVGVLRDGPRPPARACRSTRDTAHTHQGRLANRLAGAASPLVKRRFAMRPGGRPGPIAVEMCWDTMAAEPRP